MVEKYLNKFPKQSLRRRGSNGFGKDAYDSYAPLTTEDFEQ